MPLEADVTERKVTDPLEVARQRVRRWVLEDSRSVTNPSLTRFLEKLANKAFDDGHNVTKIKKALKTGDKALAEFSRLYGFSPAAYLNDLKMSEALRLVRETRLKIWQIAEFAGVNHAHFTTRFNEMFGEKPTVVRRQAKLATGAGRATSPGASQIPIIELLPAPEKTALSAAEAVWQALEVLPSEEQRVAMRSIQLHTRELVDLLGQRYVIVSRSNRQRGIVVAELALLAVQGNMETLGEQAQGLLALAHAWLANAKRLALDFDGAEVAIDRAEKAWAAAEECDRQILAVIYLHKGSLFANRRKFDRAIKMLNEAIRESRTAGPPKVLVQSLLLRAAVNDYARLGEPTLPDLQQALRILDNLNEPRLKLGTHMSLAYTQTVIAQYDEALKEVANARAGQEQLPELEQDPMIHAQLHWLEGLAHHGIGNLAAAQPLYENSYRIFHKLGELEHLAITALDLARLHGERGLVTASAVLDLATEALHILQGLKFPEALEAAKMLQDALKGTMISSATLYVARVELVRNTLAPQPWPCR